MGELDVKAGFKDGAIYQCKPDYPRAALEQGQEGKLVLHFTISREGSMQSVAVTQSSGYPLLDRATVNALSRCEFKAATHNGQAVDGEFDQVYIWKLKD